MSREKARHSLAKSIVSQIRGPRYFRGEELTGLNLNKVLWAQRLFVTCIADTLAGLDPTITFHMKRFRRIVACLNTIDVFDFFKTLDTYEGMLLQQSAEFLGTITINGVLDVEASSLEFIKSVDALMIPVRHASCTMATKFAAFRQVSTFVKRVSLNLPFLEERAFDSWLQVEMKVWPDQVAGPEKSIISKWFPIAWDWTKDFDPRHGPGAVAEGTSETDLKWWVLTPTYSTQHLFAICGWDFETLMQCPFSQEAVEETPTDCRVLFVPKSWKTFRTISAEPCVNQWLQQGFGACVDSFLKKRVTSFSQVYCLNTEHVNRHLARLGSFDGEYATIDLSAASDSVPQDLVCEWFADSWLYPGILWTRSARATHAFIKGGYIEQKKFAPMGSRLCFPVETIVFAAICESSCRQAGIDTRECHRPYVVYGDDIVILKEAVPFLLARLEELGFKVNKDKSFFNEKGPHFFRESCGGEYFDGVDVTPTRLPRFFPGIPKSRKEALAHPATIASLIDLCNLCFGKLPITRLAVLQQLQSWSIPFLFDEEGKQGIRCNQATNLHLPRRWNSDLQRWEVKCWHLEARKSKDSELPDQGAQRLFETLRRTQHRKSLQWPEDDYRVSFDPYERPRSVLSWIDGSQWHRSAPL